VYIKQPFLATYLTQTYFIGFWAWPDALHDTFLYMCLQGSGEDEIVVCAWDGMTYIVDQGRNVVRYQLFEDNISAFCAGKSLFRIGASLLVNE